MPQNYTVLHKWQPSIIWWMMVPAKWRYLHVFVHLFVLVKPIYAKICGNITSGN